MKRKQVWRARLNPKEGSEQGGLERPVLIVSRDAINNSSSVVVVVPLTDADNKSRLYPSHVLINNPEANLLLDSVALCEQVRAISKTRLSGLVGEVTDGTMDKVSKALKITLDL